MSEMHFVNSLEFYLTGYWDKTYFADFKTIENTSTRAFCWTGSAKAVFEEKEIEVWADGTDGFGTYETWTIDYNTPGRSMSTHGVTLERALIRFKEMLRAYEQQ